MSNLIRSGWSILLQTVAGASRSVFLILLVSGFWFLASIPAPAIIDQNNNGEPFPNNFDLQTDPDGDGWTNEQEATAGTDPFDANPPNGMVRPQALRIPAVYLTSQNGDPPTLVSPEAETITWQSVAGKQYTLQFCADLMPNWLPVGAPMIGTGDIMSRTMQLTQSDGSIPPKLFWRISVSDIDSDGDGLTDAEEAKLGTDAHNPDTDGDGMPDAWEILHGLNPNDASDAVVDANGDGYTNLQAYQNGFDPSDYVGPVNLGFNDTITEFPEFSFRPDFPSDLYPESSIPGWKAAIGEHIEIWNESDGNPYVELQSHWDAHGVKQTFKMIHNTRMNFMLRYKGRYGYDGYNNGFDLKVEGAAEMQVDGAPAGVSGNSRIHPFMETDEWEQWADWHYAVVSITAVTGASGLTPITLSLVPKVTTSGSEEITYGGFVDLMPIDVVAVFGCGESGKSVTKTYLENAASFQSGNVYMINGKDQVGADKTYTVLLGESEVDLKLGLSTPGCIIVFEGHSNMGVGPAFDAAKIKRLSDFTNIANPRTAVNQALLESEYPSVSSPRWL